MMPRPPRARRVTGELVKAYIGITDYEWYTLLGSLPNLEEVNFWQPGGKRTFGSLQAGELFLFKLHAPRNFIVGGGLFAHATRLPVSLAWDSFGEANGARSLSEMRSRIEKYRKSPRRPGEDYTIGCILLEQPFFFPQNLWIPVPSDWSPNIVQGKTYALDCEPGRSLYAEVVSRLGVASKATTGELGVGVAPAPRFGAPQITLPRLGQGSFRVLVTDAYQRQCAITGERVLPVLEAAHIRPYARGGLHDVENGLLLREDIHTLFDRGYVTVTPSLQIEVSRRIREEFDNGRHYYALHGKDLRPPVRPGRLPAPAFLDWHNREVYLG